MLHTVTQYLRKSAELYPKHTAFADNKCKLTYEEVLSVSEKIAYEMIKLNLFKKPIAVLMQKSAGNLAAFLGVAMSGNYYSVIDEKMPSSRIEKIINTF